MQVSKAARRYATAMLQLAKERDEVEDIMNDMDLIRNTVSGSRELMLLLRSPIVKSSDKEQVLKKLFGERVTEPMRLFLDLLVKKDREDLIGQIAEAFIALYNDYKGIIVVEVASAQDLSDKQQADLQKSLENRTGKTVRMNLKVDESLKGGLTVRIEDTVIDGSVKNKLQELQALLHNTSVN